MSGGPNPVPQELPKRLPMLDAYVAEHFGIRKPLAGVTAVLIQHQLGSQVVMTRTLLDLGIDPGNLFWVDIPYTSNAEVGRALLDLGIPPGNFSESTYRVSDDYAAYQRKRVQALFSCLAARLGPADPLIVLDDGSYFLEAISCFKASAMRMAIVEQTTRGIIKIRKDATLRDFAERLPVINVAESEPKKNLESPFVGEAVCRTLVDRLRGRLELGPGDQALILGFGAIGRSVADSLESYLGLAPGRIHVCDPRPESGAQAGEKGYRTWTREGDEPVRFKLVVGCSGTTSFGIGDRVFLEDGACLASASSGAAELSREEFIDLANSYPDDHIYVKETASSGTHDDIEINLVDRTAVFLNGGFPVNFDGRVNCVHPKYIQATHTLQVGAACQAASSPLPGLTPLDAGLCDWVCRNFEPMIEAWDG